MKTIGIRGLRENPGILSQSAAQGELVLVTNRNDPIALSVPFSDELIEDGVHVNLAVRLFESGALTLSKAARMSRMSIEDFLEVLAVFDILVVDQSEEELASDLANLHV